MIMTSPNKLTNKKGTIHWFHHVFINLLLLLHLSVHLFCACLSLCLSLYLSSVLEEVDLVLSTVNLSDWSGLSSSALIPQILHMFDLWWVAFLGIQGSFCVCLQPMRDGCYNVTSYLVGWHAKNDPWVSWVVVSNHLWTRLFPRIYSVVICWDMGSDCISLYHTGIIKGSLLGPC